MPLKNLEIVTMTVILLLNQYKISQVRASSCDKHIHQES